MITISPFLIGLSVMLGNVIAGDTLAQPTQVKLSIASQNMRGALNEWARQTGYVLVAEIESEITAPSLQGTLTPQAALRTLLAGTTLTCVWTSDGVVTVRENVGFRPTVLQEAGNGGKQRLMEIRKFDVDDGSSHEGKSASEDREQRSNASEELIGPIDDADLEEVVVTGTLIRGVAAVGARVETITREDIDRSGYVTMQDLLKSVPQNFGGGISEDTSGDPGASNLNDGSAVNLRGLGADSTLVLVNGRRQAAGGLNGAFVDISSIASSAVERVEILPDGASAIYGSDAVGGVVNFILRKDYEGAETRARVGQIAGDATETQISQLLGSRWERGHILLGYQYYERQALRRSDFSRTRSDDLTSFGGSDFRDSMSNPANILDPVTFQPAYAVPAGQDGRDLVPNDLIPSVSNLRDTGSLADHAPAQEIHSVFTNLSYAVGDDVELFADARFARRESKRRSPAEARFLVVPASNPFFTDPFGEQESLYLNYDFSKDLGSISAQSHTQVADGAVGMAAGIGNGWQLSATGFYGSEKNDYRASNLVNDAALASALADEDPNTAFNPFGDGSWTAPPTLNSIRATQDNSSDAASYGITVVGDGPLFQIAGKSVRLAVGAERRGMSLESTARVSGSEFSSGANDTGRWVTATFAELAVPLIGASNQIKGIRKLDLSLAGRYESYSDKFGTTFDPKLGISWSPIESLKVRASWGTSFKAPRLIDLLDDPNSNTAVGNIALIQDIPDPQSTSLFGTSPVLLRLGGNKDLRPETAKTLSVGMDWTVPSIEGVVLSATYFQIETRNRIALGGPPGDPFSVLLAEDEWASIINRTPSESEVRSICESQQFLFGDCAVPPAAIVDLRLRNLAQVNTKGVDVDISQKVSAALGEFGTRLSATYVLDFERSVVEGAPTLDISNTFGNIPALRIKAGVYWRRDHVGLTASANYTGDYEDSIHTTNGRIGSFTTVDLGASYDTGVGNAWIDNVQIAVYALNVADRAPPFADVQFYGYDTANADLTGRVLSAQVTKKW